jgi:nucleotide-binding universal stress UspA family protein
MAEKNSKAARYILVPTDFSDKANRAVDYAAIIAGRIKARILLLHVIELPHGTNLQKDKIRAEHEKLSRPQLKKAVERIKTFGRIKVETLIRIGAPVTTIVATANEYQVELICMGNRITSGFRRFVFDTTTSGVIDLSSCPVLATTAKLPEIKLERMLFATDYKENDLEVLKKATSLAKDFSSEMHVIHVSTRPGFDEKLRAIGFETMIRKSVNYKKLHFKQLRHNDVEEGLDKAIAEIYPHLVILIHQNRSFLDAVFGSNVIDDLIYRAEIPVLVYPV